jgi:hypothetical protein
VSTSLIHEPHGDPAGVQAGINRHRDIAKYLVGIFAAIGGLLLAGTQLSSLGQLSLSHDRTRLLVAGGTLIVALAAVILIVALAVSVLQPVEMSLADVINDKALREAADRRPGMLGGASSVEALELVMSRHLDAAARGMWQTVIADVVEDAAFRESKRRFDRAWIWMIACAIAAATAIAVFAYAANPPKDRQAAEAVIQPAPQPVRFTLTQDGRTTLAGTLGSRCVTHPIDALAIGGTLAAPVVVTLPRGDCLAAQFVLSPTLGIATATPASR